MNSHISNKLLALFITSFLACQSSSPLSPTDAGPVIYEVEDYRYLEDRYFFLDEFYREHFQNKTRPAPENQINVQSVRIFLNDFNIQNDIEEQSFSGIAYAFWDNGLPDIQKSQQYVKGIEEGLFHEFEAKDFTAYPDGYIVYERGRINPGFTLATIYQTESGAIQGSMDLTNRDNLIQIKLIKAKQQRPVDPTYRLSWRNVYNIGERNISPDGLSIHIKKWPLESDSYYQDGILLSQLLGLNIYDPTHNTVPGWDLDRGHFIFPDIEPFENDNLTDISEEFYQINNIVSRAERSKYTIEFRRSN